MSDDEKTQQDDNAENEGGPSGPQAYPKLICPFTGKKAHPRKIVSGEETDYIQYAAEEEPSYLVSLAALDAAKSDSMGYTPLIRRTLAFVQELI